MPFNPEACGALCARCALRDLRHGAPVRPEASKRGPAELVIVGDVPAKEDVDANRNFLGQTGTELDKALKSVQFDRSRAHLTQAVLCRPPGSDLSKMRLRVKAKIKASEGRLLDPVAACRPRLLAELARVDAGILTLGGSALEAVLGRREAILVVRGGARTESIADDVERKIMPTLHPGFVLKNRRWMKTLRIDFQKAADWFRGVPAWVDPVVNRTPTVAEIRRFLSRKERFFAYDVETDAKEPTLARLRCIGIGTADAVLVIPILSVDGISRFYTPEEEREIRRLLIAFFTDPRIKKVGHNAGMYDRLVIETRLGVTPKPLTDTILLHRSVESELPHSLGYVGSVYTGVTAWKQDKPGTNATTDEELHVYNATDVAVTARIVPPLIDAVRLRGQEKVVRVDHRVQSMCAEMHTLGLLVDPKRVEAWDKKLLADALKQRRILRDAAEDPNLNPLSVNQLKSLLFEKWDFEPVDETDSGEPSTDDDTILELLRSPGMTPAQRTFLSALRLFRRATKLRGTYVVKLKPRNVSIVDDYDAGMAEDDDENDEEKEWRLKDGKKKGIIYADGRVRASWNAHVPKTGRIACAGPNLMNQPQKLRDMYIPGPGHAFVYADMDQLELRLATNFSRASRYLEPFLSGGDPHSESTRMVLGAEGEKMYQAVVAKYGTAKKGRKEDPDWSCVCDFGKRFTYAALYKATVETVMNVLRAVEDDNGTLIYDNLTLQEVQSRYDAWIGAVPEFVRWWEDTIAEYRQQGFLLSAFHHRRSDFLDGDKENELVNWPCQCVTGETRVITSLGYRKIADLEDAGPFDAWTGHEWAPARVIRKGTVPIRRVTFRRTPTIEVDVTHKFLRVGATDHEWATTPTLQAEDRIALAHPVALEFGKPAIPQLAYWLGFWMGDGCVSHKHNKIESVDFTVSNGKGIGNARGGQATIDALVGWLMSHGFNPSTTAREGCSSVCVYAGRLRLIELLGVDHAPEAKTKRIPEWVWSSSLQDRKDFIRGFLDTDGCAGPDGPVLHLANSALLDEVWLLARTCGIDGGREFVDNMPAWRRVFSGADVYRELGWGRKPAKKQGLELAPAWEALRCLPDLRGTVGSAKTLRSRIKHGGTVSTSTLVALGGQGTYDYDSVQGVEDTGRTEPVFTLSVDHPKHRYVAGATIAKNSTGSDIVNEGSITLLDGSFGIGKQGRNTGMVVQCHDALMAEVPIEKAAKLAKELEEGLFRKIPGHEVPYTASSEVKLRWKETKEEAKETKKILEST